jgi:flagellar biosynthesis protein FlhF
MQIKKYVAPTLKEVTDMMKNELGADAVILSTKVIEKNKKKYYELTAGVEKIEIQSETLEPAKLSFLEELKKVSRELSLKQSEKVSTERIKDTYGQTEPLKTKKQDAKSIDEALRRVVHNLKDKEVQKNVVVAIIEQMKKYKNFLQDDNVENYAKTCLSSMILTKNFDVKPTQRKVVALVGSTGVGKTTTIAKLALIAKMINKLDVGLISIDTFRLGAIDQLQSFADVSQIDLLVAYTPDEMTDILKRFAKKDIIFIDTVGRSQNRIEQLKQNLEFLKKINVDETFLVLSSTSSYRTILDTVNKFRIFNYSGFIFTKTDEAPVLGNIVNIITKTGIPVSFITNGQVIPDDIVAADAESLANLIYDGNL